MAGICYETPRSREGDKQNAGATRTREFVVLYEADEAAAIALVEAAAVVTFGGMERKALQWRTLGAPDLWLFTVPYGAAAGEGAVRPDNFNFRIVATTAHVTQSLKTLARIGVGDNLGSGTNLTADVLVDPIFVPDGYAPADADVGKTLVITGGTDWVPGYYAIVGVDVGGGSWTLDGTPAAVGTAGGVWYLPPAAPDCKGAIGQSNDTVAGCEIVVPGSDLVFSAARTSLTDADVRALRALVGTTNATAVRGYPAGTLLYLGCEPTGPDGTLADAQPFTWWNLAHSCRYEPHRTNVQIGDVLVPFVEAHAYVWAQYRPAFDLKTFAVRPSGVYVERNYANTGDFSILGID